MVLVHQCMILTYVGVLTVKSCDISPDVCEQYGFGSSANGEEAPHPAPQCKYDVSCFSPR